MAKLIKNSNEVEVEYFQVFQVFDNGDEYGLDRFENRGEAVSYRNYCIENEMDNEPGVVSYTIRNVKEWEIQEDWEYPGFEE